MAHVFKRKDFARWQAGEKLPDVALCKAVKEMESNLIDADLGGCFSGLVCRGIVEGVAVGCLVGGAL